MLKVEQLHTTGGGWQDQIGAIIPGFKLASLTPSCGGSGEKELKWRPIELCPALATNVEDRLILVYTGRTRLAKNLLRVGGTAC